MVVYCITQCTSFQNVVTMKGTKPWNLGLWPIIPSLSPVSSIALSLSAFWTDSWVQTVAACQRFACLHSPICTEHIHTHLLDSCQHTWSPSLTLTLSEPQICCMMCACCGNPVWEERQRSSSNTSSICSIGRCSDTLVLSAPSIFSLLTFKRAAEETREEGREDL